MRKIVFAIAAALALFIVAAAALELNLQHTEQQQKAILKGGGRQADLALTPQQRAALYEQMEQLIERGNELEATAQTPEAKEKAAETRQEVETALGMFRQAFPAR